MNDVKQKSTSQCINVEPTPMNTTLKNALTYAKSNYKVFRLNATQKAYTYVLIGLKKLLIKS